MSLPIRPVISRPKNKTKVRGSKFSRCIKPSLSKSKFNDAQRQVVEWINGPVRVSAGPGSGKTFSVVERIAHMIKNGTPARSILATTFTKKAVIEMNDRLKKILGDQKNDFPSVQTMHSFCIRLLKASNVYDGIDAGDNSAEYEYIVKNVVSYEEMDWKRCDLSKVLLFISLAKNSLIRPSRASEWDIFKTQFQGDFKFIEAYSRSESTRQLKMFATFDDMLIDAVELLQNDSVVRNRIQSRYKHVIVDEFQDSNEAQIVLTNLIAAPEYNLMVVGDVDQSLYEWRGAKPIYMVNFPERYPETTTITMDINYRSKHNIVSQASKCIEYNENRISKSISAADKTEGIILCRQVLDTDHEATLVADEIDLLLADGLKYKDIYVLFRMNAQSRSVEEVFTRREIPHVVLGATSFYQRKEIQDVLSYLKLLVNPVDKKAGDRAVNRPFRFIGRGVLQSIHKNMKGSRTYVEACETVASTGKGGHRLWNFADVMNRIADMSRPGDILTYVIQETDFISYLISSEGSDTMDNSRADNIGEVIRSASRFNTVEKFLSFVQRQIDERRKPKRKQNAVICMSIHKSKGLEAPAVFLLGCNDGILPHVNANPDHEEERRLFFVAMTRAEKFFHVSSLDVMGSNYLEPSPFISEAEISIERINICPDSFDKEKNEQTNLLQEK